MITICKQKKDNVENSTVQVENSTVQVEKKSVAKINITGVIVTVGAIIVLSIGTVLWLL